MASQIEYGCTSFQWINENGTGNGTAIEYGNGTAISFGNETFIDDANEICCEECCKDDLGYNCNVYCGDECDDLNSNPSIGEDIFYSNWELNCDNQRLSIFRCFIFCKS